MLLGNKRCAIALYQLDDHNVFFPPAQFALKNPNGLLAIGGDLSTERLITAYHNGIFPWFSPGEPILWWSPDPRGVLYLNELHISRSLKKSILKQNFRFSVNRAFGQVIENCSMQRANQEGTWISPQMRQAYQAMNEAEQAFSVEVWQDDKLVGGLYGVLVGGIFCGESMFHRVTDASKAALCFLVNLCRRSGIELIDCQMQNAHLASLGVSEIPRQTFLNLLNQYKYKTVDKALWFKQINESLNPN